MYLYVILLFTVFSVLSLIVAYDVASSDNKCSLQLQRVLADPATYSESYLRKISAKLNAYSKLLFTSQASSVVANFEQEFGVTVSLQNPFKACNPQVQVLGTSPFCNTTSYIDNSGTSITNTFTFDVADSGLATSVSVPRISGSVVIDGPQIMPIFTLISPSGTSAVIASSCMTEGPSYQFNFGLVDNSSLIDFDCSAYTSTDFRVTTLYNPSNPFTPFLGEDVQGTWSIEVVLAFNPAVNFLITEMTLAYCTGSSASTDTCYPSSNMARANLNIPGYRYDADSGIAHYTTEIRNCQGEMLYATISRSIANMFIKK